MKHEDAQLVHRCLAGDDSAFTTLVKKHQKRVHALAWRKVGDFHIAEELAQDTFLKAYQKLGNTEEPESVCGMALCHHESALHRVASKTETSDGIVRNYKRSGD